MHANVVNIWNIYGMLLYNIILVTQENSDHGQLKSKSLSI